MSIFKWFKRKNEDPLASILSEEKEIENVKKKLKMLKRNKM